MWYRAVKRFVVAWLALISLVTAFLPYTIEESMPRKIVITVPAGYATHAARGGEQVQLQTRGFSSTGDGDAFIQILEGFASNVLAQSYPERSPSVVDHMLVLMNADGKTTVFVNELRILINVHIRRTLTKQGESIFEDDILDIASMNLGLDIPDDASFIFIFSRGWRKGVFFDFLQAGVRREFNVPTALGPLYTFLGYQHLFKMTEETWTNILNQRWFPFIFLGHERIKSIVAHSCAGWQIDELLDNFREYIIQKASEFLSYLETNPFMMPHMPLIRNAFEEYREGDYISCSSILYTRLEGIMRSYLRGERPGVKLTQSNMAAIPTVNRPYNIMHPEKFSTYLREVYFADFDPNNTDASDVSRHSVSHGVAPASAFSLKGATTGLLTLMQVVCFMRPTTQVVAPGTPPKPAAGLAQSMPGDESERKRRRKEQKQARRRNR